MAQRFVAILLSCLAPIGSAGAALISTPRSTCAEVDQSVGKLADEHGLATVSANVGTLSGVRCAVSVSPANSRVTHVKPPCENGVHSAESIDRDAPASGVRPDDGAPFPAQLTRKSPYDVRTTASRLEEGLKSKGNTIFASLDQQALAKQAGLELRPTQVIIFGNPKVGTLLMQQSIAIASDLPLRITVWQDDRHQSWVTYSDLEQTAMRDGISDFANVRRLALGLDAVIAKAVEEY